jgi:hypothetical protein
MLSKFAILFFIMALAIFLFGFSQTEKAGLCSVEAGSQAAMISNSISNVLNNPVEDQQLLVKLPPAITLGSGLSAYTINVTYINSTASFSTIEVAVGSTSGGGCEASKSVYFPSNVNVSFYNDANPITNQTIPGQILLTASPSALTGSRAHFFLIIKCTNKKITPFPPYLFVIACTQPVASSCSGYGIYNTNNTAVNNDCGFS